MERKNDLCERLFEFSVRVIEFLKTLPLTPENKTIRIQLSKSACSAGANYEESQSGSSKADFSNNANWPIYDTTIIVPTVVPSSLDKTLFATTNVFGKTQLTYNGWPLYYFGGDGKVRGNTKGITVPSSKPVGSVWPVMVQVVPQAPHK